MHPKRSCYSAGMRNLRSILLGLHALLAAACLGAVPSAQAEAWQPADSSYAWHFPEDHWSHPNTKTEWWYLTAQLQDLDDPAAQFGMQFTLFRIGLTPEAPAPGSAWSASDLVMGHAAIGELAPGAGRHHFSEVLYRATPLLGGFGEYPDSLIAWCRAPAGTDGRWTLTWNGEAFDIAMADSAQGLAYRLATKPEKPLVFQGPNGYSRKGAGPTSASQYVSFTRLTVEGTLRVGGRERRVRGLGWFDQEFGSNQLEPQQVGWDWFSLQLDDSRELMLYQLRDRAGRADWRRGTLVEKDGRVRYLAPGDWTLSPEGAWTSPATKLRYPERWRLALPSAGLALTIVPRLAAQENASRLSGLHYWEGAVELRGAGGERLGQGYVEQTGVGGATRPSI